MDEELEQPKKITASNFFESIKMIDRVADRAFKTASANAIITKQQTSLLRALESGFQQLQGEVQQITNYIIVDQDRTRATLDARQRNIDKIEDNRQKGIDDEQKGLEDDQPFSSGNKLLEGLSGAANQFLANNADLLVGGAIGLLPFSRGRLVPGSGNSDTVRGLLTPGEFVIPKNVVDTYSPTFFEGLVSAADTKKKDKKKVKNPYGVDPNSKDFAILTAISSLEGGDSQARVDVAQSIYNRFADVQSDISDGKMDDAAFDYTKSSFKADESGKFPKLTLSDIILKEGQYQPAFKDPTKTEGTIAPEFSNITDKDTAILAMKSYFDKRGDKRSMKDIEKLFDQTAKDLQNEKLIKSAQEHVGGNTEFLSGDSYQEGDSYRGELGVDNTFFSKYGSGNQVKSGAAPSPLISPVSSDGGVPSSSVTPNIKSKIQNQELSQNISEPPEDDNMSTEILPPIGGDADTSGLQQSAPNFGSASIASEQLSDTSSMIPFIDVISNQYLSIV
tara:strand:- start:903 stop:2417 length:1515 start_codon:yes stop_codon:yes gene_type:complete